MRPVPRVDHGPRALVYPSCPLEQLTTRPGVFPASRGGTIAAVLRPIMARLRVHQAAPRQAKARTTAPRPDTASATMRGRRYGSATTRIDRTSGGRGADADRRADARSARGGVRAAIRGRAAVAPSFRGH